MASFEAGLAALIAIVEAFPERAETIGLDVAVQDVFDERGAIVQAIASEAEVDFRYPE